MNGEPVSVASAVTHSVEGAQEHEAAAAAAAPPAQSVADGVTRSIAKASISSADGEVMSAAADAQSVADGVTRSIERASGQAVNGGLRPAAGAGGRSRSGRLLLPNSVQLVRSWNKQPLWEPLSRGTQSLHQEADDFCLQNFLREETLFSVSVCT